MVPHRLRFETRSYGVTLLDPKFNLFRRYFFLWRKSVVEFSWKEDLRRDRWDRFDSGVGKVLLSVDGRDSIKNKDK